MPRRTLLLVSAVLLLAVVTAVLLWRGCRHEPPPPPSAVPAADFVADSARLVSPDLALGLVAVRGLVHPAYTDWACLLECRERRGCRADVKLEIRYRSAGEERSLSIAGRLEGKRGETMRIGRVQRPPVAVDRVEQVTVTAVVPVIQGAPRPTPMQ
jgi:hypothetical protein